MNYKDLQNKAKELGLPYVGVPRIELEKNISEKTGVIPETKVETPLISSDPKAGTGNDEANTPVVDQIIIPVLGEDKKEEPKKRGPKPKQDKVEAPSKTVKDTHEKANTATIYDGSFKVRAYTLEAHGEKFDELAMSFVSDKPKYRIVFTYELPNLTCKNCGAKIRCSTCGKEVS